MMGPNSYGKLKVSFVIHISDRFKTFDLIIDLRVGICLEMSYIHDNCCSTAELFLEIDCAHSSIHV